MIASSAGVPLLVAKNVLYHVVCLGRVDRYFRVKGRLVRAAARLGGYEGKYLKRLPCFVPRGCDAVDAGANVGVYTLALAARVGTAGRVLAVEPVPELAAALERVSAHLPQVTVCREVLSDGTRDRAELRIPLLPGGVPEPALAQASSQDARAAAPGRILTVPAARLDDHLPAFRDLRFIKADLEGHEPQFLAGADQTIRRFRPVLQLEAAGLARHPSWLHDWMATHRYALYHCPRRGLAPPRAGEGWSLNLYLMPRETVPTLPPALFDGSRA